MAGYSGTPLPRKLGLKANLRFGAWNAPASFAAQLGELPPGVTLADASRGTSPLDVIVCFVSSLAELTRLLPRARKRLDPSGGLWLCWPKKASGIKNRRQRKRGKKPRFGLGLGRQQDLCDRRSLVGAAASGARARPTAVIRASFPDHVHDQAAGVGRGAVLPQIQRLPSAER